MKETYTTGKFAKLAGVSERTVRYYDQQGLLHPSFVMENGYRSYTEEDMQKLQKILTLKYLGFSLSEIKTMLIEDNQEHMKELLEMQVALIDQKIQHMNTLKESLLAAKEMADQSGMDWKDFSEIIDMKEQDEKIVDHYRNANHLAIRIQLHQMYSTNPQGWFTWLLKQINFQSVYRLLEIGCGDGEIWKQCQIDLRNREVFLSDISEGMVETVRQWLGEAFSYMVFDCQKVPFKKDYFDAVMANHMLFYVQDINLALKEISRVLRAGGVLYCSTYGPSHMKEITDIVQAFDPEITLSDHSLSDRFGLVNGAALLEPYFSEVTCVHYEDALKITDAGPLFDYIMSCHGNQRERLAHHEGEFREYLERVIQQTGYYHVSKDAGLFICKK